MISLSGLFSLIDNIIVFVGQANPLTRVRTLEVKGRNNRDIKITEIVGIGDEAF